MKHRFFPDDGTCFSPIRLSIALVFSALTLFTFFFIFYEWGFSQCYWKNRWRLLKLLRNKKVKILDETEYSTIILLEIEIEGEFYEMLYWKNKNKITLSKKSGDYFIGLFITSPFMYWENTQIVKEVKILLTK
jgi:hypothetical protein